MRDLAPADLRHRPRRTVADWAEAGGVFHIGAYRFSLIAVNAHVKVRTVHRYGSGRQAAEMRARHVAARDKHHHQGAQQYGKESRIYHHEPI